MTDEQKTLVLATLDALGLALANHDHQWTDDERAMYEQAVEACQS